MTMTMTMTPDLAQHNHPSSSIESPSADWVQNSSRADDDGNLE
jgi:hypothetical protein